MEGRSFCRGGGSAKVARERVPRTHLQEYVAGNLEQSVREEEDGEGDKVLRIAESKVLREAIESSVADSGAVEEG